MGRPTLTFAIDVASRCILGMHLSFEPPGVLAVAMCLIHAVQPKEGWLREIGAYGAWPMHGLMRSLHTDNGREFLSAAFVQGCSDYGISVVHRPVATPRFGGVVERAFGTFMPRIQAYPGGTFSRRLGRRPKNLEKTAALTLDELRCVLTHEVVRYHQEIHRELQTSPQAFWNAAWSNARQPSMPSDPQHFFLSFLPSAQRVITREGIDLFGLEYWDEQLRPLIRPRERRMVRFDPRDLTAIYVSFEHDYLRVQLRDHRLPKFSLLEWREIRRRDRRSRCAQVNPDLVAHLVRANVDMAENAVRMRDRKRWTRQCDWLKQPQISPAMSQGEFDEGSNIEPLRLLAVDFMED